jgi:hypothetical protein
MELIGLHERKIRLGAGWNMIAGEGGTGYERGDEICPGHVGLHVHSPSTAVDVAVRVAVSGYKNAPSD